MSTAPVRQVRGDELVARSGGVDAVERSRGDVLGEPVGVDDRAAAAERHDDLPNSQGAERAIVELESERRRFLRAELEQVDVPKDLWVVVCVERHLALLARADEALAVQREAATPAK